MCRTTCGSVRLSAGSVVQLSAGSAVASIALDVPPQAGRCELSAGRRVSAGSAVGLSAGS
jgi:hypothetical protein